MADLIDRQAAIDAICGECQGNCIPCEHYPCGEIKALEQLPSAQPQKCSDILDELKDDDYYNYIHTGHSRFSEDDWDYLIRNTKEKEKLHERLDKQTGGD